MIRVNSPLFFLGVIMETCIPKMDIRIGFRPDEAQEGRHGRAIIFKDGLCYLRNFEEEGMERFLLQYSPDEFLSELSNDISHEFLHLLLFIEVSEDAFEKLNVVDGWAGHLLEDLKICRGCGKRIYNPPYIIHGWLHWHKKCFKKYHKDKCIICSTSLHFDKM